VKRVLLTGLLFVVLGAALAMGWLLTSESGLRWAYRQADALLPGELHSQQLSGNLNDGITLRGLEYHDDEISLAADRLILHWNPWALLQGRIEISRLATGQLEIELHPADDDPGARARGARLPQLDLPLDLRLQGFQVDRLRLGRENNPLVLEQLKLKAASRGSEVGIEALSVRIVDVAIGENRASDFAIGLAGDIDLSGDYPHTLQIDWQARLPAGDIIDNSTRINGDLVSTQLLQQSRGALKAELKLALRDLLGRPEWQAELNVTDFDTTRLDSALPLLRGNLVLSAKGDSDTARATGQLDAESRELGPFGAGFALRSLDPARIMDGVQVETLKLAIFDGELAAQGWLYWAPVLSWESTVSASKVNPARLLPDWSGSLGGRLHSRGRVDDGKLFASASIAELGGTLRGYPLSLQGEIGWQDDSLEIESARLVSGDTRVVANGRIAGDLALDWSLDSRNLAELYPAAQGRLVASGHLGGEIEAPIVRARFNGKSLRLDDYAAGSIDGDMVLDLLNWTQLDLRFAAREVELRDQRLRSVDVNAGQRRIEANLVAQDAIARIELSGELHDQGWSGKLISAEIDSDEFDSWRLQKPAALSLSADASSSEPLCLRSSRNAQICASFRQLEETWDIDLGLTRVPLKMLRRWTPAELDLDGIVNATADLQYHPEKPLLGTLQAEFPTARARYPLQPGKPRDFDFRNAEFGLLLEPEGLKVSTRLDLQNGDRFEGRATLPGANILQIDLERQTMQAAASIEMRDWTLLGALVPQIEILRGELEMNVEANGSVTRPRLRIDGHFGNGTIHLLDRGIKLDQIDLDLKSNAIDRLEYQVKAVTASGRIAARGNTLMNRDNSWTSVVSFDAEEIDLASALLPWVAPPLSVEGKLRASGELGLDIDASGNVGPPRLQLIGHLGRGAIRLLEPEFNLEGVELDLQSSGTERIEFSGNATAAEGRIAIHGNTRLNWDEDWPSRLSFNGEGIDIATLLAPWVAEPLTIAGKLDADGEFEYRVPDHLLGELRLSSARGKLGYPLLERTVEEWVYRGALATLTLTGQGINARSSIEIGDNSGLLAELTLPRARLLALDFENQPLRANAQVNFEEIDLIQLLIPEVDELEGALSLEVTADGSISQPLINARARIPLASFKIPRLGLQIEQVSLFGESDDSNRFDFRMSAVSGSGHLSVHGSSRLESLNLWTADLRVRGSEFEVSRIPEAQVSISPDLSVRVDGRNIHVEGDLLLPHARLEPKDMRTATRVSKDSIVIGGDEPREERWLISTRINLSLGEQVSFSGFGFEGSFGGSLLIEDRPGQLSTGNGEITILEGVYRAYGQRLDIDGGRVLFSGGALDNPSLDLRAQRLVNDVTVGLTVGGRLQQPDIELFSIPTMGETDTLSYLLFGHPAETATDSEGAAMASAALSLGLASSGFSAYGRDNLGIDDIHIESSDSGDQASLVIGRYLSPRMYVSYGVGLVESLNSLNLRYQLADRWHLEAESGEFQGADLLFTIER
jgi:autotransporter translocation and assembly factor TamB